MSKRKPNKKTVRDAIKASVPEGKLRRAKIVLKDKTDHLPVGGFTEYDRAKGGAVVKLGAPASDDAFGISIRAHECAHAAKHKPTRKKPMTETEAIAGQIVDDVNIEVLPVPTMNGSKMYRRAKLAVAMQSVRTISNVARAVKEGRIPTSVALRNGQLLHAVRTIAMLRHYGAGDFAELGVKHRGLLKLREAIGTNMLRAVGLVANIAKSRRQRAKAISVLLALLEREPESESEGIEGEPNPDGEILSPVQDGDALDGHMEIRNLLPKSVYCAKEKRVTRRSAPNGVIINPHRFVAAIVSGISNGLFSRRVRQEPGGCVLIDASGSMGATRKNLSALCELVPTATVGYYSGSGQGHGNLCVYADKGMRFAGELPEDSLHGGNGVDLPAIRWLMKHPRPWVLVSDLQFCGGVLGSEAVAHALVERAQSLGLLKVYRSLDEAYTAFGGKGELKNE